MSLDILSQIVERRKADIARLGISLGHEIPAERNRALHPFVQTKSVVLEVKRASPSKGDIAPGLDAAATALAYQKAGAGAISVLTEENWFKGGLDDLKAVCAAVDIAVLRKDFLIYPDEIDVAYKCGADAVLLIARILDQALLEQMLCRCASFGLTAFVELRLEEDLQKLAAAVKAIQDQKGAADSKLVQDQKGAANLDGMQDQERAALPKIVCGVNARDLKDFSIDLLTPCGFLPEIKSAMGQDCPVVFESGIRTPQAAAFAGSLGFAGMLLGEAAARDTQKAGELVSSFVNTSQTKNAASWNALAKELRARKTRPLVKICGITNIEDARAAADLGADFLGFVFCAASPRAASQDIVRQVRSLFNGCKTENGAETANGSKTQNGAAPVQGLQTLRAPRLVGVVTELSSPQGAAALRLAQEGVLDYIQLHGKTAADEFFADPKNAAIPHYCAANLGDQSDLQNYNDLRALGQPRVLVDAKAAGGGAAGLGGTGNQAPQELVLEAKKKAPLWLAGGLGADNVRDVIQKYSPELIDASSRLESEPGKKDLQKLRAFFEAIK